MDIEEIRQMTHEELTAKLNDLKKEKSEFRIQNVIAPPENPMRSREIRRTIARIKTVLQERELKEGTETP